MAAGGEEALCERLGGEANHRRREDEQGTHRGTAMRRRERADHRRRANEVRLHGRRARGGHGVSGEESDQDDAVSQRDPGLERKDERVHGRRGEEEQTSNVAAIESNQPVATNRPGQEGDHRPADAKEQPVRARHVGDGVRSEAGVGAGLPREHDVDGVFRQHGEQRNHDQRERAGDIALRGFRTPRHREGRADDTEAEDQCADLGRSRQETGSKQHGGNARDDDEPEGDDAARRGMPDGGDPHVCAPHGAVSASLVGALKKTPDPPHTAPRCGMGRRSGWAGYDARR